MAGIYDQVSGQAQEQAWWRVLEQVQDQAWLRPWSTVREPVERAVCHDICFLVETAVGV
jgi:hypothetical protein